MVVMVVVSVVSVVMVNPPCGDNLLVVVVFGARLASKTHFGSDRDWFDGIQMMCLLCNGCATQLERE